MLPVTNASALRAAILESRNDVAKSSATQVQSTDVFGDMMHSAAQQIAAVDKSAQDAVNGLLSGQGVEVHEAMIATQKADLQLELALQVRNKAVAAYQQMMQMQF